MQPQGTGLINTAQITALTNTINNIDTCAELQAFVNTVMADFQAQVTALEQQCELLKILTTIPTSLSGVITWITNFVNQYTAPYLKYIQQLEQTIAEIAQLTAAIESAAQKLESCAVSTPSLVLANAVSSL